MDLSVFQLPLTVIRLRRVSRSGLVAAHGISQRNVSVKKERIYDFSVRPYG